MGVRPNTGDAPGAIAVRAGVEEVSLCVDVFIPSGPDPSEPPCPTASDPPPGRGSTSRSDLTDNLSLGLEAQS